MAEKSCGAQRRRMKGFERIRAAAVAILLLTGAPGSNTEPASPPQPYTPEMIPSNVTAAALSRTDALRLAPDSLTGSGIVIGAWDAGTAQASHPEFGGRVIVPDGGAASSHATHVAGTIMASGSGKAAARGMAPAATLLSHDFYGDILQEQRDAWSGYGMLLSNHSWDYAEGWLFDRYDDGLWTWYGGAANSEEADFGAYGSTTRRWDQLVVDTGLIIVKSSGNERNDTGAGSAPHHHIGEPTALYTDWHKPDGDYDSIGPVGVAKNVISVGAVDAGRRMTAFSGWGPTDDGRIKPDIVTDGIGIYSTINNNGYGTMSGTSMATAVASGSLALLIERYQWFNSSPPSPALMKALVANTAIDLGNRGPDYAFGWGLLDTWAALNIIDANGIDGWPIQSATATAGATQNFTLDVPASLDTLKVTIAWTDPAAAAGAVVALVNDLDLELVDPLGAVHYPFSLAGKADPAAPATTTGPNSVDNIEQVAVDNPVAGTWQVRIRAAAIQGSQAYDMVSNVYLGAEGPLETAVLLPASASGTNTTAGDSGGGGGGSLDIPSLLALLFMSVAWRRRRP
ncbi:MAG TPA: hypothetical protein ENJ80_04880 [Gammaproteobacteria bacterium]|nr:hypothetical protein [Gammaproteobacteria bacterium]